MTNASRLPSIVRVFDNTDGHPHAMNENGEVFDVTNMFTNGEATDSLAEAEIIVVRLAEDSWLTLDISDKTPWDEDSTNG